MFLESGLMSRISENPKSNTFERSLEKPKSLSRKKMCLMKLDIADKTSGKLYKLICKFEYYDDYEVFYGEIMRTLI